MTVVAMLLLALALVYAWVVRHRLSEGRFLEITPFLGFCVFEVTTAWPAPLFGPVRNSALAILMGLAFVALTAGYAVRGLSVPGFRSRFANYIEVPVMAGRGTEAAVGATVVALVLAALTVFLYGTQLPGIEAVQALISGDRTALGLLSDRREALTKGYYFGAEYRGQGLILNMLQVGWPFVLSVLVVARRSAPSTATTLTLVLTSGFAFLSVAGSGSRYSLIALFAIPWIALTLARPVRVRSALATASAAFALAIAIAPLSPQLAQITGVRDVVGATTSRIFLGNGVHNVEIAALVDSGQLPLGGGRIHYEKAVTALPGVTAAVPFSRQVQLLRSSDSADMSFASSTYMGVLYADFGAPGVVIVYFLIGVLAAIVQTRFLAATKTPAQVALVAGLVYWFSEMALGSAISASANLAVLAAIAWATKTQMRIGRVAARMPVT